LGINDSDYSRDSIVERPTFGKMSDVDVSFNSDLDKDDEVSQMYDPESNKWYRRVMKWTTQNRRAYLMIKTGQFCCSIVMLLLTIFFFRKWNQSKPNHPAMYLIRLIIALHACDLVTFMFDYFMVCKRAKALISFRFVTCTASVAISAIVQFSFYDQSFYKGELTLDFQDSLNRLIIGTLLYVYQTYLCWAIINIFMFFQILEMENKERRETKIQMRSLTVASKKSGKSKK
jgi:hypothetical protein